MRSRPASVRAPVLAPPWSRQRPFLSVGSPRIQSAAARQGWPARVRAPPPELLQDAVSAVELVLEEARRL